VTTTGYQIAPAGPGGNPVAPGEYPRYLQIRVNGVDLGGPDVTVLDFVGTGFTLERGTGDDAGTVTLTIA
jgi:hypothetical protein